MSTPAALPIPRIRATHQQREPWRQEVWVEIRSKTLFWGFVHEAGHSGTSLADKVGCSRQLISAMARGERTCKPDLAHKIAAALNIPPKTEAFDLLFRERRSRISVRPSVNTPSDRAA